MVAELDKDLLMAVDPWSWAYYNDIQLLGGPFKLQGHEYQVDILQCKHPDQVVMKAAQMTITEVAVLRTIHRLIHRAYPNGALYLFPTKDDVTDFSKGRFDPLIENNQEAIGQFVYGTDAANIKKIGSGMLYLRGARATANIKGMKKSSSRLKTVPVDGIVFDEFDEMAPSMIGLAMERVSHSNVKDTLKISTPTIPDYGIDAEYNKSDRRSWLLKCTHCNSWTCLEDEFPKCVEVDDKGIGHRLCSKCKKEIFPWNGKWVARAPLIKDKVGWQISQLNSIYINPASVLDLFNNPPEGNLSEVYNSKLGQAYVAAENRLTPGDILQCCGVEAMRNSSTVPHAMGVDVGTLFHVVIGRKTGPNRYKISWMGRLSDLEDVHDIARDFNVKVAVIDKEPETRKVREFQRSEPYTIYLCDYAERMRVEKKTDEVEGVIVIRRTEILDSTHHMMATPGVTEIPRKSAEIDEYAKEMCNTAKILKEDDQGNRTFSYIKLSSGGDHYRHSTNYFKIACDDPALSHQWMKEIREREGGREGKAITDYKVLEYQLKRANG